ncbi:hypothetical protein ABLE91_03450 [Aquabacter sp. CN5-332]|uniref:hypothetical protein n=1 Tax=Aquabacter sp. CN5-332 TaxID=3156608 RepID=UPI0032B3D2C4
MDSFFRLVLRLILIPAAILIAATVQAIIVLFGQWQLGAVVSSALDDPSGLRTFSAILNAGLQTTILLGLIWTIGAVGILFSEAFAVRSWMFHVASGTVSAFLGTQLYPVMMDEPAPLADPFYVLATGLAGGLVYWLVAGWGAGFWKAVLSPPRAPALPPPPA